MKRISQQENRIEEAKEELEQSNSRSIEIKTPNPTRYSHTNINFSQLENINK
jgi:hypothetical protein